MQTLLATLQRLFGRGTARRGVLALDATVAAQLARSLAATTSVEYSCAEVYRLLDEFAEAHLRGEDIATRLLLVQQHLDMCPDCRQEYEALLRALRAESAP